MSIPRRIHRVFYYLLLAGGGLFMVLAVLAGMVYYIAVSDQERVPEIIEKICQKSLGAEATFSHYRFQYLEHFPFLSLALEDVVLRDPCYEDHGKELLRIGKVNAVFRPWKLLKKEFELRSVFLDSARIQLYRPADGDFNISFLEKDSIPIFKNQPDTQLLFSIKKIRVRNLSFEFEDDLQNKHFRFDMRRSNIGLVQNAGSQELHLRGKWFFHGLVFKEENGAFLHGQESRVDLKIQWGGSNNDIRLLPSSAIFGADTLHIAGRLAVQDSAHLRLEISTRGILLENALPLLADNLCKGLEPFSLNTPIPIHLSIQGPLLPGQPLPMKITFQAEDALLTAGKLQLGHTALRGQYVNNCSPAQPITPHSDCLDIEVLSAQLLDSISLTASYHAEDMKVPMIELKGKVEAALKDANALLPRDQVQLRSGKGELSFSFSGPMKSLFAYSENRQAAALKGKGRILAGSMDYLPSGLELSDINASFSFDGENLHIHNLRLEVGETPYQLRGAIYGLTASLLEPKRYPWAKLEASTPHLDLGAFLGKAGSSPPTTINERKSSNRLLRNLQGAFIVNARKFSYRKLEAKDARFTGRLLNACKSSNSGPCLQIDSFSALLFNTIPVNGAMEVSVFSSPQLSMGLQMGIPLSLLQPLLPADKLSVEEGQLKMNIDYQGSLHNYSGLDKGVLEGGLKGHASIADATVAYLPRDYHFRNLNGRFHFNKQDLFIDSLRFNLNGNDANAEGVIEQLLPFVFNPKQKVQAVLNLTSPELDLNRFPIGKPAPKVRKTPRSPSVRITKTLEAFLAKAEGVLKVKARKLYFQTMRLDEVAFEGRLLQSCEGQPPNNGCVEIEKLSARLFGTAPFHASLRATNLEDPFFVADVQVDMPLRELNRMFAPGQFRFEDGMVGVRFHYEGQPHGHFDAENALLKAQLKGEGLIRQGEFEYKPRGYRFAEVNTHFSFDEKDLAIQDIQLLLNENSMKGKGKFHGFLPFLFLPGRSLKTSIEVEAEDFNLDNFKAPQKFQQPSTGSPQDSTIVTLLVNAGLENIHASLQLSIDSVRYRNFRAAQIRGGLTMKPGMLHFENTKMALCDGSFALNGRIEGLKDNSPDIDVAVQFRNTDIQKVFQAFDNFGQQGLTSDNIEGQLNADISFRARANDNYDLLPASMNGRFGLKVQNGALINLPALDSLQSILLRGRGLSNIQFATMENSFDLMGQDLQVNHFFVASTALSFGVEGRFALGGQSSDTNLLFEVPLANLFWQGKEVDDLESLHQKKRGPSILLRATEGEQGGLNFKWVLSKK